MAGATGTSGVDVEAWINIPTTDEVGRPVKEDEVDKDAHFGIMGRVGGRELKWEGGIAFVETIMEGAFEESLGCPRKSICLSELVQYIHKCLNVCFFIPSASYTSPSIPLLPILAHTNVHVLLFHESI